MYLTDFRVVNFMSFRDSGPIQLTPGFNLILGRNDPGKSAVLSAVSLNFRDLPHRTLTTEPVKDVATPPASTVTASFETDGFEIFQLIPIGGTISVTRVIKHRHADVNPELFVRDLGDLRSLRFTATLTSSGVPTIAANALLPAPFEVAPTNEWVQFRKSTTGTLEKVTIHGGNSADQVALVMATREAGTQSRGAAP